MRYEAGAVDVIVVGAGHAGCEAGLAAARLGCETMILTLNLENVAMMPCNPSIGGPAKGHLVREIDALGGEMGLNTDRTSIQTRMLNSGKGPAVRALRAQTDKRAYQDSMKWTIENQEYLQLRQGLVVDLIMNQNKVEGVVLADGAVLRAKAVVLTSGTYLKGRIVLGEMAYAGGPNNQFAAGELSEVLIRLGLELGRFKTGTPARIDGRSIDTDRMILQPGDPEGWAFSFLNRRIEREQIPCWLTYTNDQTHQWIRDNLHRSPLYAGIIEGIGPRYCPSIEDKVVRFADRSQHQVFIEPEGLHTREMYVQGMSTSLPPEVQIQMLRTIRGLEQVKMMRPGYAIEYDYILPTQLNTGLQCKAIPGLFCGGQVNGTSGYEEAAAQGLLAGINAAQYVLERDPFVLNRDEAYLGVLIDDLVLKGTSEPYRLMTSRAEYRLLLRHDNADLRLTEKGFRLGLASEERYQRMEKKYGQVDEGRRILSKTKVKLEDGINGISGIDYLKRPENRLSDLMAELDLDLPNEFDVIDALEISIKYDGYITRQTNQVDRFRRMEGKQIPDEFDYSQVRGLSTEGAQKLQKFVPQSIGQASRISGVSPADIAVLLVFMEKQRRQERNPE